MKNTELSKTTSEFVSSKPITKVIVIVGTNIENAKALLARNPNELVFASDNIEIVAHYYEGCVIEMEIELDARLRMDYARNKEEVHSMGIPLYEYGWGMVELNYPQDAVWYSMSGEYIKNHLVSIKEIFPDLTQWEACD